MNTEGVPPATSPVYLIGSSDREAAVRALYEKTGPRDLAGKRVAIKANFNSADPFPASTHLDTLRALVEMLQAAGTTDVTLAERSGMGDTRRVLEKMGVFALARELDLKVIVLDEEPEERWEHFERAGTHWMRGFYLAKEFLGADVVVQTCCLKTHRFGGHFTMSLKNSIGLVAKRVPGHIYDYMYELHGSPYQRLMIAEVNQRYPVHLVIMDASLGFISGGPEKGDSVEPGLMLASADRVAIDAAGVAILRDFGATSLVKKPIFELEQIRRAAELGIGATSAEAVELIGLDAQGKVAADRISAALAE